MRLVATHTCVFQKSGKNKRNKSLRPCTTNHPPARLLVARCALKCPFYSAAWLFQSFEEQWLGHAIWILSTFGQVYLFEKFSFIKKAFPFKGNKHLKTRFFLKKESPYALTNPVQLTWNKLDTVKHICQSSKNSGMNSFAHDGHCTSSNEGNCSLVTQFTPSPWFHVQPIETHLWLESDYKTFPHSRLSINRVPIVLEEKSLTCI